MKVKTIDHLGRVVIPKPFRTELGLTEGTPICFHADPESGSLMIRRANCFCLMCKKEENLIEVSREVYLCSDCIERIVEKKLSL